MNKLNTENIKYLREVTGAAYVKCKNALDEAGGDKVEAMKVLRKNGAVVAKKKASRVANEGVVGNYMHYNGRIGVIVEVNCETDFAASTKVLMDFAKDIAMQIASSNPEYIKIDDVTQDTIVSENEIYAAQAIQENIPAKILEKYMQGKLKKFYAEKCLLEQKYYRDSSYTVRDVLNTCIARIGENIIIKRFCRYEVG